MARPLSEQIVVVIGASSGIGRETAMQFSRAGAKVVLAARNEMALQEVAESIRQAGGEAMVVPTDVADWWQVQRLAEQAANTFGRIDTWVNNAAVSVTGTAEETTVEETNQVMQINFMGLVHGVKAVLPYMKRQGSGTIINLGSIESDRAFPYHSVYSASKHAVKAYTEALRMELQRDKSGVEVTLIQPAGINTPFFNHSRSKIGVVPQPPPPVYKPELVAEAILSAAVHPQRNIYIGGMGVMFSLLERINPKLADWFMTRGDLLFRLQESDRPDNGEDTLFETIQEPGRVHGDYAHLVKPSLYTRLFELSPMAAWVVLPFALVGALIGVVMSRR